VKKAIFYDKSASTLDVVHRVHNAEGYGKIQYQHQDWQEYAQTEPETRSPPAFRHVNNPTCDTGREEN
jgi:hypothetical protein